MRAAAPDTAREAAPMLRSGNGNGNAADDEEAVPPWLLVQPAGTPAKPRRASYYNRTQTIMWRIICVLAALSLLVIVVFAPLDRAAALAATTAASPAPTTTHEQGPLNGQQLDQHGMQMHGCNTTVHLCGPTKAAPNEEEHEHYRPAGSP
ncbi:hypothetical protein SPI_05790 [Niveomyces insectorum RCEF 264]|uniref:Uncharacterized protein n=1 Tax=Niveomyces insectorum RCEF 264 TaxID=1081102 RepID=A0A167SFY4_9HYPO|nr:hypothetical protein SPI_05790 [Niveomyces insectorum RCEF 264]